MRPRMDQAKAKAYDVLLADRMPFVQLASHRMQQALDMPEVRGVPEPAIPFQLPWPKGIDSGAGLGLFNLPGEKNDVDIAYNEVDDQRSNSSGDDDDRSDFTGDDDDDQDPEELLWRPPPGYVAEVEEYEVDGSDDENEQEMPIVPATRILPQAKGRRRSNPTPRQCRKRLKVVVDLVSPSPDQQVEPPIKKTIKQQRPRPTGLNLEAVRGVPSIQITGASPEPTRASASLQLNANGLPHRPRPDLTGLHDPDQQVDEVQKQAAATNTVANPIVTGAMFNAANVFRPASPPPPYLSPRHSFAQPAMPAYWSSNLSRLIYTWLLHEEARAVQTEVVDMSFAHIQSDPMAYYYTGLPSPPSTPLLLNHMDGRSQATIKITRLLLPDTANATFGEAGERDWFVIQSTDRVPINTYTAAKDTMSVKTMPQAQAIDPYWILAFPTRTITDIKTDQVFTGNGVVHRTRLMLGCKGLLPVLHGRNIRTPYFVDGFMRAFSQGEGVIQTVSTQALPLRG